MPRKPLSLIIFILIAIILVSCSGAANQAATETEASNQTQAVEDQAQTEEARSAEETQAAKDSAAAAEIVSEMETQTAIEEADAAAASAAKAVQDALNAAGTQQVEDQLATINEVLQEVGYSTDMGNLGWIQTDTTAISIPNGNGGRYELTGGGNSYGNFVIHYNAKWETTGFGGCSLILRSEKDLGDGQQYIFNTLRFSGLPGWDVELNEYGRFQSNVTGSVKYTNKIKLDNAAINNYVLVANGATLTVYINGDRISGVTVATRSEGYFGFYGWQTDGSTTCTYSDAWIWELP